MHVLVCAESERRARGKLRKEKVEGRIIKKLLNGWWNMDTREGRGEGKKIKSGRDTNKGEKREGKVTWKNVKLKFRNEG